MRTKDDPKAGVLVGRGVPAEPFRQAQGSVSVEGQWLTEDGSPYPCQRRWTQGLREASFRLVGTRRLTSRPLALVALGLSLTLAAVAAELDSSGRQKLSQDSRAMIVVTGMLLQEDATGAVRKQDLSVAEGATVRLVKKGGKSEEKTTAPFAARGARAEAGYWSADFFVDLDATYEVTMTFRNGTVIRLDDYRLPKEWRTHFYFHSTRGTKSAASVLRIGRDEASGLSCYVYAVFPLEAYRALGGRQLMK